VDLITYHFVTVRRCRSEEVHLGIDERSFDASIVGLCLHEDLLEEVGSDEI